MIRTLQYAASYGWNRLSGGLAKSQALNAAYSRRHWTRFDALLQDDALPEPIALLWRTMRADYFQQLESPVEAWRATADTLVAQGHFLSYLAHQNFLSALVTKGLLTDFNAHFPRQHQEFRRGLPLNLVPSVGALYLRAEDPHGWLGFLKWMRATVPAGQRKVLELKAYAYVRWAHEAAGMTHPYLEQPLVNGMGDWLAQQVEPESPAAQVLDAHNRCWAAIRTTDSELLLEVRYRPEEAESLRGRVLGALQRREPLMFLRMGDGEAYAFSNEATEAVPGFREDLEQLWWGKALPVSLRESVAHAVRVTLQDADIIGLPSMPRLAQVLHAFNPGDLSPASRKQLGLFEGVEEAVHQGGLACMCWVDEYANYAFVNPEVLQSLMAAATNTVVVGCFEIPRGHFLQAPHVHHVPIPPVQKVAKAHGVVATDRVLPEVLDDLQAELAPLLRPGTLCLLAAGFAGKPLLQLAKSRGAVALDLGSGLDHLLGHRTRSPELHHLFG